jgi:hypothetical protein
MEHHRETLWDSQRCGPVGHPKERPCETPQSGRLGNGREVALWDTQRSGPVGFCRVTLSNSAGWSCETPQRSGPV